MKNQLRGLLTACASTLAFALVSCDVDKKEDGSLPEVKVQVDGEAKLPKYDVNGPDVTVGKKKVEMEVPTVDINIPKEEDNEPATKPAEEQK
ncbi:hypothetical protein OJ996_22115 [Luteolibacter sp. GHJ8]|uniref:Secreted protein n=1 Tax=Luteolibacter rhizosphaerae TaxID=2989719 RepID=A0ABT3G8W8_9BACT|nr:hypothetical protein [Luteolibacter rhizosphaerae]MCW1916301.1 hypothetical protein [Luteolibacter rhizosphaerae]